MLADRVRIGSSGKKLKPPEPPETWAEVQQAVRDGWAEYFFSVDDELTSLYNGREIIWQVIGIDVDIPSDSNYTHSMTVQTKDCVESGVWDSTKDNRYINSDIRAYLNNSFLSNLDTELSSVIGLVNKKVAIRNDIGGGQDSFSDKVFLLSRGEVGLGGTGEFIYPFYSGKGDANRIKNLDGSANRWWLRSPLTTSTSSVYNVEPTGIMGYRSSHISTIGVSPGCVII